MTDVETRSSCSTDSLAASDLSESVVDRDMKAHGIFEARAAMASRAGHVSRFTKDPVEAMIHFRHVADMLRVYDKKYLSSGLYSDLIVHRMPGADKFLRESFIALKRMWIDRSFKNPHSTLEEMSLWRYSGSAAKKEMALVAPGRVLGKFVTFVLKVVSHRDACDSVIEPGFELLDAIARSRYSQEDREVMRRANASKEEDATHVSFSAATLRELLAVAFPKKLSAFRRATMLRATQTLSAYVKPGSSDPPVDERADCMLRAGFLYQLIFHVSQLYNLRLDAASGGCDDERRESGASDETLASYSGRFSIESVGHADGEEDRVRRADVRGHLSDDQRLHACLALFNSVLRVATLDAPDVYGDLEPLDSEIMEAIASIVSTLFSVVEGMTYHRDSVNDRDLFTASEKRKALEATTLLSRRIRGGGSVAPAAVLCAPNWPSSWRLYISKHCLASREADPSHEARDDERSCSPASTLPTFYRRAPAFDARLSAADVGLALRDAAELLEVTGAETGSARWFEEVRRLRLLPRAQSESARHLVDLTVLATSRGFYSRGSSLHWHATCAHAGAVLRAATLACDSPKGDVCADPTTPGFARGTPDLLLAAAELEERCRGTVHASLARRAAAILASTSATLAREAEIRVRDPARAAKRKRAPREKFRVTNRADGKTFYMLV